MASDRTAIVVGLKSEARIAAGFGCTVGIGGGTTAGALDTVQRLAADGATALISFGLAGGLAPGLRPGTIIVPETVLVDQYRFATDPALSRHLGGPTPHCLLGVSAVVGQAVEKQRLWQNTGADAVDMESGIVAEIAQRYALPFAVLRVICDPAERSLPRAALAALDPRGGVRIAKVLNSLLASPGDIPSLLSLAADAFRARRALQRRVAAIGRL